MRKTLLAGGVFIVSVAAACALWLSYTDDRMILSEGLHRTIRFVNSTAAVVAPRQSVVPEKDYNAEIKKVDALSNNHSLNDHSNSRRYPGFNDCDSWKNVIIDGWSAVYGVKLQLKNMQKGEELLDRTMQYWVSQGFDVNRQVAGNSSTRLWQTELLVNAGYATFQLNVDWNSGEASIRGTTDCLPPR